MTKYLEIHDARTGRLVDRKDISALTPHEIESTMDAESRLFNHLCTINNNGVKPVGYYPIEHNDWACEGIDQDCHLIESIMAGLVLTLCGAVLVYAIAKYVF